jgi:hypothetical protein
MDSVALVKHEGDLKETLNGRSTHRRSQDPEINAHSKTISVQVLTNRAANTDVKLVDTFIQLVLKQK